MRILSIYSVNNLFIYIYIYIYIYQTVVLAIVIMSYITPLVLTYIYTPIVGTS